MADVNINLLKQCIGIDQTVPGTTNKVVAEVSAIPAITGTVAVSNMIPAVETGLATSAKQLADNHQVQVSNIASTPLITGFATSAKQLPDNHQVTANAGTNLNTSALATSANQGKYYGPSGLTAWKEADGKPRISSMSYLYDIAEGNVPNHTPYAKLGYNGDVGATEEDIITQGGVYPWIAAGGIALEVVSSDANDTLAGTGVQKVKITYLDTDYSQQTQTLDMAGLTPVPLTDTTILRVNSIRATQVGTAGMSVGNITCRLVGGAATVYRQIAAGFTRGRGLTYTVPLGKTLYLTSISVSSGFTTTGKVVRWIGRAQVDDTAPTVKIAFFQPFFEIITQDASFHADFDMPIAIPATADLKVSATSNGAGSFCSCALRGWIE
jgi:hypothetical protein